MLNAKTKTQGNLSSRSVERILQNRGYISIRGAVYHANGIHEGNVGYKFMDSLSVSWSGVLKCYLASNLKDQMELEIKLRKAIIGEPCEEVRAPYPES